MRILIWNMQGGSPGGSLAKHESAWRYLRERDPDVALLQEATVPAWAEERWGSVIHEARRRGSKARGWGSAVIAKDEGFERFVPGEETPWLDRFRGGVVLARAPWNQWFASVHVSAQAERLSPDDAAGVALCAPPKVWEVDLVTHDLGHFFEGRRFVAGGDLNASLAFDSRTRQGNARLFDNLRALGVNDLRAPFFDEEQRTFYGRGQRILQLDHVFGDPVTREAATSWRVLTEPAEELGLSDHAPIEVEL